MRKTFLSLFVAAGLAVSSAHAAKDDWAMEASQVAVSLDASKLGGPADVAAMPPLSSNDGIAQLKNLFKNTKASPISSGESPWYVVNIPIKIHALGRNDDGKLAPARFVKELEVTAYLLVAAPKEEAGSKASLAEKYYLLKKEITYTDIAMEKTMGKSSRDGKTRSVGKADMCVGVFLPALTCSKLTGKATAVDSGAIAKPGVIAGFAIEASFNNVPCKHVGEKNSSVPGLTESSKLFDKNLARDIGDTNWWKERKKNNFADAKGAELMSIAETPYAPFYAAMYPPTKPLYGSAAPAAPAAAAADGDETAADGSGSGSATSRSSSLSLP